jgi:hypothetical protein
MTAHPFRLAGSRASGMGLGWLAPVAEMAAGAIGNWPLPPEPGPRSGMCRPKVATCTPGTDAGSVHAARDFTIATFRLGLVQPGPCLLCAVADPSQQPPVPQEPSYLAETGRGLHVISALADTWGYTTPSGTGKVVWAMFFDQARTPALFQHDGRRPDRAARGARRRRPGDPHRPRLGRGRRLGGGRHGTRPVAALHHPQHPAVLRSSARTSSPTTRSSARSTSGTSRISECART